jgi:spore coat polysaccharide biosynthesis protein SpsF
MVLRQLERVRRARRIDDIVVAVPESSEDDDLARVCKDAGYRVVRGDSEDVLSRFLLAADASNATVIVRITADCPLISPHIIDLVIDTFHASDADYVSNTLEPTYPDGLDVEVVTTDALRNVARSSHDPAEREHVTLGVYRYPERFAVCNVVDESGHDHSNLRWTVDTPEDLEFVRQIYDIVLPTIPEFDYGDILDVIEQRVELCRDASAGRRNAALDGLDTGAMKHGEGGDA